MNLCEIGLFHILWGVSKGTRENNHEIWWKWFRTNIYIYQFQGFTKGGGERFTSHFLFIINKNKKSTRSWPILKSNSTSLWFTKKVPRINNKKKLKRGPRSCFFTKYSSSNWFQSTTNNSRHIFNTNMYSIHFYSKNNIKMHFPKSWVLKFQNCFRHSLYMATWF